MQHDSLRTRDLIPIFLFSGILISCSVFLVFFMVVPSKLFYGNSMIGIDGLSHVEQIKRVLPIFRFTLICILVFLSAGVCVHYFRKYRVNYIYIIGIDPVNRLNQFQFYKIFLLLATAWVLSALLEVLSIKGYIYKLGEER